MWVLYLQVFFAQFRVRLLSLSETVVKGVIKMEEKISFYEDYDNHIISFDGHDGAGKTTIAKKVAEKLKFKYIKPFESSLGDLIAWSFRNKKYDFTNKISKLAIEKSVSENPNTSLIFDRHWMSMFTVLPEQYYAEWNPLPFTILIWVDWQTTMERLIQKGEKPGSEKEHQYYCDLYLKVADNYGVPVIDTTKHTIDECIDIACGLIDKNCAMTVS
jgi:thymidylate kinase